MTSNPVIYSELILCEIMAKIRNLVNEPKLRYKLCANVQFNGRCGGYRPL